MYNLSLWKAGHAQSHQESASKPCFSSSSPSLTPLLTEDNWIFLVPRFLELSTPGCLHQPGADPPDPWGDCRTERHVHTICRCSAGDSKDHMLGSGINV